jgi:hypothetical protein
MTTSRKTTSIPKAPAYSAEVYPGPPRSCRVCGCHNDDACFHTQLGNCWWIDHDLCSHCHIAPGEAARHSQISEAEITVVDGAYCD